jgi:gliding-associated putative ABC transporter substrate-binding component GldG
MRKISFSTILVIAILLMVNLLGDQFFFRLDLTEDKQYTLSKATKDILKSLEDPITVTAYFSENLPSNVSQAKNDVLDYLTEYSRISNHNLVYKFIDPSSDDKLEAEAMQNGIRPVMINVREKDQVKQQKAYLGLVIEMRDQKEIIPFVQPGAALEYALSSSIKKVSLQDKPLIGIVQSNGEAEIEEIQQVDAGLSVLYDVQSIDLLNDINNQSYSTVALINTKDSLNSDDLKILDNYLETGGNILIAMNSVIGDFTNATGSVNNIGLFEWLKSKGITVGENFVIDSNCSKISVQQQQGFFRYQSSVSFPYLPIISNFADHPITKGIEAVVMEFASSIEYNQIDTSSTFTPLAFTSKKSNKYDAPLYFEIQKQWKTSDFTEESIVVGGVLENKNKNGTTSRICLFSDGDFSVGGKGQDQKRVPDDNVNLLINSIDWMTDDTGLIDLRTKGIKYRPIDELEDSEKTFLKYLNFLLPIILVLLYGLLRLQANKLKRVNIMSENYE